MRLIDVGEWIPIKLRPMTEEEKEAWAESEYGDYFDEIFDCPMPEDGQLIWVTSKCGNVWQDTCEDDGGLLSLEENGDWDDIVAWMPVYKPEPYKEGRKLSKLKSHEIVKVVSELIGCTVPQGDPALDTESMDNLDNLIAMTWWSLNEIAKTARCKDDPEEMGEHAQSVLLSMADWIAYVSLRNKEQP